MSVTPWYKLQVIFGDAGVCCVAPLLEDLLHLRSLEAMPRIYAPLKPRGRSTPRKDGKEEMISAANPLYGQGTHRTNQCAMADVGHIRWLSGSFSPKYRGPNPSNTVVKKKGEMMKIHKQVFSPLGSDGFTVMFTVGEEHGFDAEAERRCRLLALELTGAMWPADVYVVYCDMVNSGEFWWSVVFVVMLGGELWYRQMFGDVFSFFFTFRSLYIPLIPSREGFVSSGIKLRFQAARIISGEGWDQQQSSQRRELRCRAAVARSEKGDWTDLNSSRYFEEMWVKMSWFLHPALDWQYRKMFFCRWETW